MRRFPPSLLGDVMAPMFGGIHMVDHLAHCFPLDGVDEIFCKYISSLLVSLDVLQSYPWLVKHLV